MSDHLPKELTELLAQMLGGSAKIVDLTSLLSQSQEGKAHEAAERVFESMVQVVTVKWDTLLTDYEQEKPGCGCTNCKLRHRYLRKMLELIRPIADDLRPKLEALAQASQEAGAAADKISERHHNPGNLN